jgi:2,4-dienoyl-CoA reductase-like NADH-dependent reductase (Old Yellow Enzyme family)/thioredoxin reductase
MKYSNLLSPIKVGDHVLKNRIIFPNASPHFLQGPESFPAEGYRAFMSNLAKNGAAVVTIAEWSDYQNQRKGPADLDFTHMQAFDLENPGVHNYLSQMAEEIHFFGSKLFVSPLFPYPKGYSLNGGRAFGPGGGETQALPKEMIPQAIANLVEKARFYKLLGYDGISMRCDADLTPSEYPREDEYGGSVENRTRLLREAFAAVKKEFGGAFLIEAVVAWEQPDGYGMHNKVGSGYYAEDTMEFVRLIEGVADILQLRENSGCTSHPTGFNFKQGVHSALDFAAQIKAEGIQIFCEPIGGFQEPDEMDQAIKDGKCDFFGVARGLFADSEYGKKLYSGRGEEITPCLKCNKCHGVMLKEHDPWLSVCSVNPTQSLGHKLARLLCSASDGESKKVAVIGGGCAGMRAAIIAAEQGHKVTLYEKTDRLGGQLIHGDSFSFKWPIGNYKNWLIRELETSGAEIKMNTEPTPDDISAGQFDAVLAATGAKPNLPKSIQGLTNPDGTRKEGVRTCLDTFGREGELGKKVVICGGSEVGVETAMYLCENGHEVTILTRQNELAHDASKLHYITSSWIHHVDGMATESPAWEKYENLHGILNVTTTAVNGKTVTYCNGKGEEHTIEADDVIICGGMLPSTEEAMAYANLSSVFYTIGDCNVVGNIQLCTAEAYARAMIL